MRSLVVVLILGLVACLPPSPKPTPEPTPEPTVAPTPEPTPTPVVGCPDPKPPKVSKFIIKKHNNLWDGTAQVCDRAYCLSIGMERNCCPARPEGDPDRIVCEKEMVGGDPVWQSDGEVRATSNPYQIRCLNCTWIRLCSADKAVCDSVAVQ